MSDSTIPAETEPTIEEMKLLDDAMAKFEQDGDVGTDWRDVIKQLRAAKPQ